MPKVLQMLRVSSCDSEAERIVADLLAACRDALGVLSPSDARSDCIKMGLARNILKTALAKARVE
jgi:hypothetical protein